MYQIIKEGKTIGLVDEPRFVKLNSNGVYVRCMPSEAEGIAFNGEVITAFASEVDGGEYIFDVAQTAKEAESVNSIVFVTLAENETIDEVTASEHEKYFAEWEYPIAYVIGNIRKYEEKLYKCVQAHTSQEDWTPDITPALWRKIGDPAEEWPEWSQPIGASDAYMKGDKVTYNGQRYISLIDNNIWAPDVYPAGWEAVV